MRIPYRAGWESSEIPPNLMRSACRSDIDNENVRKSDSLVQRIYRVYNARVFYQWDRKIFGTVRGFPPRLDLVPKYLIYLEDILKYYVRHPHYGEGEERVDANKGLRFLRDQPPHQR